MSPVCLQCVPSVCELPVLSLSQDCGELLSEGCEVLDVLQNLLILLLSLRDILSS